MAVMKYLVGKNPGQTQFGLDTFTEHWKCDATADVVLTDASVPSKGSAHPDYPHMFCTDRYCSETGQSASMLDITYQGALKDDGDGNPVLPPTQPSSSGEVASATTNTDADIFPATVTNPATVQFYAITNAITVFSDTDSTSEEPDDPPEVDTLITWDLGFGLQPGISMPALITYLLTSAFVQGIIEPPPSVEELVSGQYYRITKRKTRTLFPYAPPS